MIVECPDCQRRYDVSGRPPGSHARCRCGCVFSLPDPPAEAATLACPNCGGNVSPSCTECTYCHSHLAIRACPRCFGKIFLGSEFCAHCGAKVEEPARVLGNGNAAPRNCPRCLPASRLVSELVCDVMLDACNVCQGVFIDADVLEHVLAERRHKEKMEIKTPHLQTLLFQRTKTARLPSVSGDGRPPGGKVYIQCPDCGSHMLRRNFARRSGVIVDICRNHGTWFDANELDHVIQFVQEGGLDKKHGFRHSPAEGGASFFQKPPEMGRPSQIQGVRPLRDRPTSFFSDFLGGLRSLLED